MKKQLTTLFLYAVTSLVTLSLTSCGEEVPDNPPKDQTVFASEKGDQGSRSSVIILNEDGTPVSGEDTRTSIDPNRFFYWEIGDKIWVKDGSSYHVSSGSDITGTADEAKFIVDAALGESSYPVFYTGYLEGDTTSTLSSSVTIASGQTQSAWNNGAHLGYSGDCGVAVAQKRANGTYKFTLYHKASYLIFQPYLDSQIVGTYRLKRIEITADGTTLAGTYPFDANGLNTAGVRSSSNVITLNCATDGFLLSGSSFNSCFVVIQPGTHKLTVRYYVAAATNSPYYGVADEIEFTKEISSREYAAGYARTIKHDLTDPVLTFDPKYYMWDAPDDGYWQGTATMANNYNSGVSSLTDPLTATRSCRNTPNVNEAAWYVMEGDPRWDGTTRWKLKDDDHIYTGGVWIKKLAKIPGRSSNHTPDGIDARKIEGPQVLTTNASDTYKNGGMPGQLNINYDYFFLPACGGVNEDSQGILSISGIGTSGIYYTSSAASSAGVSATNNAYRIAFTSSSIFINGGRRDYIRVGGTRANGTSWFQ